VLVSEAGNIDIRRDQSINQSIINHSFVIHSCIKEILTWPQKLTHWLELFRKVTE